MEKLNPVTVIPHSENTLDEEVEFTTSTQYVISGSTSGIFKVKGAIQVREISVSTRSTDGDPTVASRPASVLIMDDYDCQPLKIYYSKHFVMSAVFSRFCSCSHLLANFTIS